MKKKSIPKVVEIPKEKIEGKKNALYEMLDLHQPFSLQV